jgi:hypothetical protein
MPLHDLYQMQTDDIILWSEKYIREILEAPQGSILKFSYDRYLGEIGDINCRLCAFYLTCFPNVKILLVTNSERSADRACDRIIWFLNKDNIIRRRGNAIWMNNGGFINCTYRSFHHLFDLDLIVVNENFVHHFAFLDQLKLRIHRGGKIVTVTNFGEEGRKILFDHRSKL